MSHQQVDHQPNSPRPRYLSLRLKMLIEFGLLFASALALVVITTMFGIPFIGYAGSYGEEQSQATRNLSLVADLKKERLLFWLDERNEDIAQMSQNLAAEASCIQQLCDLARKGIEGGETGDQLRSDLLNDGGSQILTHWLNIAFKVHKAYRKIQIADSRTGFILASTDNSDVGSRVAGRQSIAGTGAVSDETKATVERLPSDGNTYLIMSRVIGDGSSLNDRHAIVLLYVDTDSFIKPMLYMGEALGETGDVVLVNQDARILMSLRYPLPDGTIAKVLDYQIKSKPASLASQGQEGVITDEDYRGVPVLAAYRHIKVGKNFVWGMVVKRDRSEIFAPLWRTVFYSSLIGVLALIVVGLLAILVARRISQPVETLIRVAQGVQGGNLASRAEIRDSDELGTLAATFNSMIERIQNWHGELEKEVKERTARLNELNIELTEEIAQRTRAEESLKNTNRRLQTLSDCNQAVVRAKEESSLLHEICRIIVEVGGYPAACVGFAQDDEFKTVHRVSGWGFVEQDADKTNLSGAYNGLWRDPMETAVRTGNTSILRSAVSDPLTNRRWEAVAKHGIGSVISIPLRIGEEYIGAITIASRESDAFEQGEVRLLEELAGDLAYGIEMLRTRAARRKAEESVVRAGQEWERTFNAISDSIMVLDNQQRILRANKAAVNTLGMTEGAVIGKFCFELVHGEKEPPAFCPHLMLMADGEDHSAEVVEPHLGGIYDVQVSPLIDKDGQVIGSVHITRDITNRKESEEALMESEARYRAVFENAGIGIDMLDREGNFLAANTALLNMLGYTEENFPGLTLPDIIHPEDLEACQRDLEAFKSGEFDSYRRERRYVKKDGSVVWTDLSVSAVRDVLGKHKVTVGVITDITERKRVETWLKESEERLRLIIDSAPIGIVIIQENKYIYANPRFVEMFGYETAEEVLGLPVQSIHVSDTEELIYQTVADKDTSPRIISHYEATGLSKRGKRINAAAWVTQINYFHSKALLAFVMDVTESKSLKEQLLQAQKMEAVGNLAGGVAHDFNNLLTVVQGYSELLLSDENVKDIHRADLEKINYAAKSGADLVRRLLMFSRKSEMKPRPMSLNQQIIQTKSFLSRTIPKTINVELRLAKALPAIEADPVQIEQVLMNLAVNATDAMPDGGVLVIETQRVTLGQEYLPSHLGVKPGDYVLLSFSDTGEGIDEELLEHIFEPFFTTKSPGKGTGLGLAVVYGIVKQHGGHVTCKSQRGVGTTFKLYLPAMVTQTQADIQLLEELRIPRGTETILLVDDEQAVRDLGQRILTRAGYTVITAANGREALDLYIKERDKISLIILDLIMPEMDGHQCLDELLRIDQQAKIILSSGYAANGSSEKTSKASARGFVGKPYNMEQLLQTVRDVLDR
jgi:PAS domain S-box-containing protein